MPVGAATTVATLDLPAGSYTASSQVSGMGGVTNPAQFSQANCTLFAPGAPQATPDLLSPLPDSQEIFSINNGVSFEVAAPVSLELRCEVTNGSFQVDLGWISATKVDQLVVQPPSVVP